jgi:hypothetical protein
MSLILRRIPAGQALVLLKDMVDIQKQRNTLFGFCDGGNMSGVDAAPEGRRGVVSNILKAYMDVLCKT